MLDLVAEQPRDFPPGERFAYSNTNYIVAGLLLEQVTDMSTADNLRTRIVEPLELTHTYLAPDGARQPIGAFSRSLPGGDTDGASYHALETAAGAAGAVVSTAGELATFIRALAHGELLPAATYAEMIRGFPADGESLGIFPSYPPTTTGISNSGAIPGFSAYMQYDPATEDCSSCCSTKTFDRPNRSPSNSKRPSATTDPDGVQDRQRPRHPSTSSRNRRAAGRAA